MAYCPVFPLKCAVNQYAWGRIGEESEVALLTQSNDPGFQLKKDEPYSELWMGTHPRGPSIVQPPGSQQPQPLDDWIKAHPDCLGDKVKAKFKGQLPYLFKVLSVNKALSIQAHPLKSHAEQLYSERPSEYPDPNHKPEMAIALTPFEGLCGFRPVKDIVNFFQTIPEFQAVVGQENAETLVAAYKNGNETCKEELQKCFTGLLTREEDVIKKNLETLAQKLEKQASAGEDMKANNGELVMRLNKAFPGDVGCFVSYFLNHMILQPGEAMFLGPNVIHAYLLGDCMECMACSDNVVRAGLTPKYKDVPTLCEMLSYKTSTVKETLFPCVTDQTDSNITIYNPPVPDFAVRRIKVPTATDQYTLSSVDSASILITINGEAQASAATTQQPSHGKALGLKKGSITFISANQSIQLKVTSTEGFLAFQAYCPLD
ncbi:mannose-6-phosphate isomerase-like [Amphiura filiformis]|uniref:mannose-6-phosphate isomerase-like n=1 Tax=Amphiura filiformis TaxID=82378 RepID=UPI003B21C36F